MRVVVAGAVAVLLLGGCTSEGSGQAAASSAPAPAGPLDETALVRTSLGLNDASRVTDPTPETPGDDAVRGRDLPTTIVYPDIPGPLPVVVFTHGLGSEPENYDELLTTWALEGFFVVAPYYPLTQSRSEQVFEDVVNQPADVSFVLDAVFEAAEDPELGLGVEGLLDTESIAVAGHSAGAITTLGLLNACCIDDRIDAAVVLAGSPGFFGGEIAATDVPVLFVHPSDDTVLPIAEARMVFDTAPNPAAFLELAGATHSRPFDDEGDPAFPAVAEATTAFLQWSLTDDAAALEELRTVGSRSPGALLTGDRLDD